MPSQAKRGTKTLNISATYLKLAFEARELVVVDFGVLRVDDGCKESIRKQISRGKPLP